jgi:hypothetical protein
MNPPIQALPWRLDVAPLVEQIEQHPEVWNTHRMRTEHYGTPHNGVSDIWVRYNDWANFDGDVAAFNGPHESVWYPVIAKIPGAWSLARKVRRLSGAAELGGVLITKIPPGGRVEPHIDRGWHAGHYRKFAVQLKGNAQQAFHFEGASLSAEPGETYTFDNSQLHWVTNDSDEDRMTLIVCVR